MLKSVRWISGTYFIIGKTAEYVASFPPPVFDGLQYAKMEGEGLGELRA